jgi:hypothetical protein
MYPGSGFITILNYSSFGGAALEETSLITESGANILTESSSNILTETLT